MNSPSILGTTSRAHAHRSGEGPYRTWYRLIRTDEGLLYIESISDALYSTSHNPTGWKWIADVPPTMAARLTDHHNLEQVASVLNSAISAMIEGAQ